MDAPNTPNPINPNIQDQDAVQGLANQVQVPAAQNPAQVGQNVSVCLDRKKA